jgi:hypothetical protein
MDTDDKLVNLPKVDDDTATVSRVKADKDDSQLSQPDNPAVENSVAANVPVPDEAADSDLIEKEWVERAKQIVEHTKDDPHEQQRAVSQMRADYLKKRYNKDINAVSD